MAVADTLQELATDLQSAYNVLNTKGGIIPEHKNTNNLAETIQSLNVGNITTEIVTMTLDSSVNVLSIPITSGQVPKAIIIESTTAAADRQFGEIFYVNCLGNVNIGGGICRYKNAATGNTSTGSMNYNNLSGSTYAGIGLSSTNVRVQRPSASNNSWLAGVTYKLTAYYWKDSQKLPMITATSDMANAQQVSNFLKNYAEDNAYTIFTTTKEDVSSLPNNGMISYTVRKQNGTSVVLSGSRYRNGVQETISNPTSNAYDCVLNNGDLVYRAVIPLNGVVYRGQVELDSLLNNTLTAYESDKVTSIKEYTFRGCTSLKYLNLPNCETVGSYALMGCTYLETLLLPNCTSVYSNAIYGCTRLTTLDLSNCTTIGADGCRGNTSLTKLVLPKCSALGTSCFAGNSGMATVDVGIKTTISATTFNACSALKTLVLRGDTVSTLSNVSGFQGTPFRNGTGGTVYVPYSLVSSYQSDTNWSALESTTFTSIEKNLITLNTLGIDITDYYEIVTTLPTSDIATDKVYLIETQTTGTYEQWFYGSGSWEQLSDITL